MKTGRPEIRENEAQKNEAQASGVQGDPAASKPQASPPPGPVNLGQARKNVHNLVGASVEQIAKGLIAAAKNGQVAAAKHLFELAGVYPISEHSGTGAEDSSLAETLLKHLGFSLEPESPGDTSAQPSPENNAGTAAESADAKPEESKLAEQDPERRSG